MGARKLLYNFVQVLPNNYFPAYPLHTGLPNRHEAGNEYRYGFQGQEKDDEITGIEGSHLDFGARIYDSRVGRWLSRDPLEKKYPTMSSYIYVANSPILFVDFNGEDWVLGFNNVAGQTGQPTNIHQLASASYIINSSVSYNKTTKEYDITITVTITEHTAMFSIDPSMKEEIIDHEKAHGSQYFDVAKSTPISMGLHDGSIVTGDASVVINALIQEHTDRISDLEKSINTRIQKGEITLEEGQLEFDEKKIQIDKARDNKVNHVLQQVNQNVFDEFDKKNKTDQEVQDIEDDANNRAIKKRAKEGKKTVYLNGKKPIVFNGKVVPNN